MRPANKDNKQTERFDFRENISCDSWSFLPNYSIQLLLNRLILSKLPPKQGVVIIYGKEEVRGEHLQLHK